jgi:hypothetical protein
VVVRCKGEVSETVSENWTVRSELLSFKPAGTSASFEVEYDPELGETLFSVVFKSYPDAENAKVLSNGARITDEV